MQNHPNPEMDIMNIVYEESDAICTAIGNDSCCCAKKKCCKKYKKGKRCKKCPNR